MVLGLLILAGVAVLGVLTLRPRPRPSDPWARFRGHGYVADPPANSSNVRHIDEARWFRELRAQRRAFERQRNRP